MDRDAACQRRDGHRLAVAVVAIEDAHVADGVVAMRPDDEVALLRVARDLAVVAEVVVVAARRALATDAAGEALLSEGSPDEPAAVVAPQAVGAQVEGLVKL